MKNIAEILKNSLYTLALWVWGVIYLVHNTLKGDKLNFRFGFISQEKVIIQLVASGIVLAGFGVAAYFIAKKYKAKKPYNVVLITLAVITGTQAIAWHLGLYKWF